MATPVIDLTDSESELADYDSYFWVPSFLRAERRMAESDRARAAVALDEANDAYDEVLAKKRELQDAELQLEDQIRALGFQIQKANATLEIVNKQVQKLRAPPLPRDARLPGRSPDCPPV